MRRAAVLLWVLLAAAACGGTASRSPADQDRDGRQIAAAIRSADNQGGKFTLDEVLRLSGGQVPSGQEIRIHATSQNGEFRTGSARFTYHLQQGSSGSNFDMLLASGQLFAKQSSASSWHTTPLAATTSLFPALRLDLVRETVLLARSISASSLTHPSAGFAHKYVVMPAPDQLEQLESIPVQGSGETTFLKTARAELDVYLSYPGDKLVRVEVHLTGTDPSDGTRQQVDNSIDLHSGRVQPIKAPEKAVAVSPAEILT